MGKKQEHQKSDYDISIIRPQMSRNNVGLRGNGLSKEKLTDIKKGLLALHTLELMAQTIYKFQITKERKELNRRLIAAMCNEMTHYQDFQVKLYEYGFRPGILRWAYWLLGCTLGFTSRLIGPKAILRVGIWVETKAVRHYSELLETIDWDQDSRKIIEKDQADELGHIENWKQQLELNPH